MDQTDDEILSKSLKAEKKLNLFISEVSDKIKKKIVEITENPQNNIKIFLFSQNLERKSILRSHFEKSKECLIVPCYNDSEITIKRIISDRLKGFKPLTNEILNLIFAHTGIDRSKVNNEINKTVGSAKSFWGIQPIQKRFNFCKITSYLYGS